MAVNTWKKEKDGMPNVLKSNPSKHPINLNAEGKKGPSKMKRNKIGQVI